jgi:hypothetical protein
MKQVQLSSLEADMEVTALIASLIGFLVAVTLTVRKEAAYVRKNARKMKNLCDPDRESG